MNTTKTSTTATDKQVNFAFRLLGQTGYNTRYMDAQFKSLGATMKERSGSVEDWLRNMSKTEISDLIDQLKS